MGKVDFRRLSKKHHEELQNELWGTVDAVKRKADLQEFLRDLLTPSEVVMLARRIRIAKHLLKGATIMETRQELGVGLTTVQAVDRWLRAKCAEYRSVFPALYEKASKGEDFDDTMKYSFKHLRKKYPAHFLLFNMLIGE